MRPAYTYSADLLRVIDGDTYELLVDVGFKIMHRTMVRLRGFSVAEKNTPDGVRATNYAFAALNSGKITITTHKDKQSFTRWIADVYVNDRHMADILRDSGVKEGGM